MVSPVLMLQLSADSCELIVPIDQLSSQWTLGIWSAVKNECLKNSIAALETLRSPRAEPRGSFVVCSDVYRT